MECRAVKESHLKGLEVLVVADGDGIAFQRPLQNVGCVVLPVATSAADACSLLHSFRPDVALVDVRLGHGPVGLLAEVLEGMGVPLALLTAPGENWWRAEPTLQRSPRLALPLQPLDLQRALHSFHALERE